MVSEISRDIHRAAVDLRPTALDDLGLVEALNAYLRQWQNRSGIAVEACFTGLDRDRLPHFVETTAYRIVVELLTNIAKHAGATMVSLTLTRRAELLTVVVEDNGRGFDERMALQDGQPHLGLMGIRERLELVGGHLAIESTPRRGTTAFVRIPLAGDRSIGAAA
jgi:signal transduction histidine kinase